ncbi:MAG: subclass B3 metallo-beta-lactamase [Pseudomonadales bacterium]
MKHAVVVVALAWSSLVGAAAGSPANWTPPTDPSGLPPNWTAPTGPIRLFDDVYWVGTEGLAAYLFVTDDGLILLDVGMPENAEPVMANIRALGHRVEEVRYLLNSHAHFDHCGGLAALKASSGAELVASAGDRDALERGIYPGWESRTDLNFPPVDVDRVIGDGDSVTLGAVTLTAHLTPGHSPGATSWSFTARDGGQTYRALIFGSASVALNRLAPDPQYPGIVDDYRGTFEKMRGMTVDAYLTPHPEQFDMAGKLARIGREAGNPFVDPTEKDRRMAEFEAAFEAALAEQQQALR